MKELKIDNSKNSAIKTGGWSNPGAKLYDTLLESFYCVGGVPDNAKNFYQRIKEGKYFQWHDYLKEAYLIAPISKIKNSPYGRTPFSRSECAYPHHVIKGDKLVVSIPGLKAAYKRACQMHILKGDVKEHLERHINELGIQASFSNNKLTWNESVEYVEDIAGIMESNFNDIFSFIGKNMGINLFVESEDSSDDTLYRITSNGVGIYEVLKQRMTAQQWREFLDSDASKWLPKPNRYTDLCKSYFTKAGIKKYNELVAPIVDKVVGNNITFETFKLEDIGDIIYQDEYQIVADDLIYSSKDSNISESIELFNESWVIPQKNFEINLDQWKKGNALWITGASGDGKSTLAAKMAKKNKAKIITSDIVLCRLGWTKEKFDNALNGNSNFANIFKMDFKDSPAVDYVLSHPDLPYECKDPETGFNREIVEPQMINFYNWLIKELSSNPKYKNNLYIVEGCDICIMDPNVMVKLPLIIVGGSRLRSLYRRSKRNSEMHDVSIIKSLFKYIRNYNERFKFLDDDKEDFRKNIKKAISESMDIIDQFVNDDVFRESFEIDTNPSLGTYHKLLTEAALDEAFEDIETPEDLLKWMDCIQYGWISKKDKKIYGTGEEDDEAIFYKEYFLQSPANLVDTKVGVCWDQAELERYWFQKWEETTGFPYMVFYMEIDDHDNMPSHTFLLYETEKGCNWFEHSWYDYRGIHEYRSISECIKDIVYKHKNACNDTEDPIVVYTMPKPPRYGCTCEEFMKHARKGTKVDLGDISNEYFNENVYFEEFDLNSLPDILYFGTPNKLDSKTISSQTPRGLFMSPYPGIASLFIIDRSNITREYFNSILAKNKREIFKSNYNIEYKEWEFKDDQLEKPLSKAHLYHNIPQFKEVGSGTSIGYIYAINVSKIKNDLELFGDSSANREIVYRGTIRLPIKEVIEHKIDWEITYRKNPNLPDGSFESKALKESVMYECGIRKGIGIDGDDLSWIEQYLREEGESYTPPTEEPKKKSMPKQIDAEENDKNGVRRKKLYIAFIEWCKAYNSKNTFGSIFDKDAFKVTYPFVPEEMRYFYRLANPLLCVLSGELTFFQASELRKLNAENSHLNEMMIFAATPNDVRVFNNKDKKVYRGEEENGSLVLREALASSFDIYIQNMIKKGDILNGPIDDESELIDQN